MLFGGNWNDALIAGAFYVSVSHTAAYSHAHIGARATFIEPIV